MRTITVKKNELFEKMKANRDQHRTIFLEAQEGYREAAIAELDKMLEEARSGKRIRRIVSLVEPMDQTSEYDRAIAMLEMSVSDTIELSAEEFNCYVLDQWRWKDQFNVSNASYSKTLMGMSQ